MTEWYQRGLDWAVDDVREWMFGFIRELCEGYDLDGFELDFMRQCAFFRTDETTRDKRVQIMTGFVREVRNLLDRTATPGQHRWLCVRVPAHIATHDDAGIDLPGFIGAGVDMVNLSYHCFAQQHHELGTIRQMVPDASVYVEMCPWLRLGPFLAPTGYDTFNFRRTTPIQYYTTAHVAFARGLDGVSTFNFVYYREHGTGPRGPFHEPPFDVFRHLRDPAWLAEQPQHYFYADSYGSDPPIADRPLKEKWSPGRSVELTLDMTPPTGGWKHAGRLRIQGEEDLGDSRWTVELNKSPLEPTEDCSEPYDNPYPSLLGTPAQHRAWVVPPGVPKDGPNPLKITMAEGNDPVKLLFVDLAIQ
jgi:hypothetical protein